MFLPFELRHILEKLQYGVCGQANSLEGDRVDVYHTLRSVTHSEFSCQAVRSYLSYKEENIRLFVYFQLNLYSIEIEQTAFRYFLFSVIVANCSNR